MILKSRSIRRRCSVKKGALNPKTAGGSQFDPLCGFSKNVSSKAKVKPWFFVTFNIIKSHIFPENFIGISQVVQKIWRIYLSILAIFIDFHQFFLFFDMSLLQRIWWRKLITDDVSIFSLLTYLNRLFHNCINLYWY